MGDDGQRGDDAEFRALQEGGGDQDAVDEIVESVADHDQQPGATVIVGRRLRLVRLAMVVMTVPPEHQLFQHEEEQDAEQHRRRHAVRVAMLERVRQDLEEGRAEQRADRVRDQHADALRPERIPHHRRRADADDAAGQRHRR